MHIFLRQSKGLIIMQYSPQILLGLTVAVLALFHLCKLWISGIMIPENFPVQVITGDSSDKMMCNSSEFKVAFLKLRSDKC
jgi:hypothetical protein